MQGTHSRRRDSSTAHRAAAVVRVNRKRRKKHCRRKLLPVARRERLILQRKQVELVPAVRMVAMASRLGEDAGEAREVLSAWVILGALLVDRPQAVDVFDGPEGLLPHLELARDGELLKTRLEALLEGLGVGEVRSVAVVPAVTVLPIPGPATGWSKCDFTRRQGGSNHEIWQKVQ